jgi:hypothetical protein
MLVLQYSGDDMSVRDCSEGCEAISLSLGLMYLMMKLFDGILRVLDFRCIVFNSIFRMATKHPEEFIDFDYRSIFAYIPFF